MASIYIHTHTHTYIHTGDHSGDPPPWFEPTATWMDHTLGAVAEPNASVAVASKPTASGAGAIKLAAEPKTSGGAASNASAPTSEACASSLIAASLCVGASVPDPSASSSMRT